MTHTIPAINDHFIKDPDSVLDYKFDWKAASNGRGLANWLAASETIASAVVTTPAGITQPTPAGITDSGTSVTAWLSGGTVGVDYAVACRIVTSAGRTDERTITITVRER